MPESFYFPIYSGLLTKEHREKIGPALWEFIWFISKTTKEIEEDDETWGIVLGGRPVKQSEIATEIGISESTVKRNIARLKQHGYIEAKRAPYGEIYRVKNSKKFKKRQTKNDLSEKRDRSHMTERKTTYDLSNKDIKDIKKEEEEKSLNNHDAFQKIADKFIQRRARGLVLSKKDEESINRLIEDNIPLDKILSLIDVVFDEYKPKHRLDYIAKFEYVEKGVLDRYHNDKKKRSNLDALDEIASKYETE
ncbi:winged helix-turn-helix transcriptional regulator [Bacillus songklensis]|uniref:Winged helix-turn-helix transcriptional regulator n=1 Tax=Bacillus songklensis TaxID=1069116 RepID=A0ABV8B1J2_9BACI